ncbi:MAG: rhodanese-like domain-containing protein [Gammaproteobacteria bacterium]|nr:MAG: rhodanese-like domain-containing protein [Gammaproteobacteria bacterium]
MEQIIEFVGRHPILILSFVAVLGLLLYGEFRRLTRCWDEVAPQQAVLLINHEEPLLLDVREANEVAEGRIKGARHIPLGALRQRMQELEQWKDRDVIVYCRSGNRSAQASDILCKAGFQHVHNLKGGVLAWQNENLPLVKK